MREQPALPAIDDEETRTVVMAKPRRARIGTGRDVGTGAQNAPTLAESLAFQDRLTQPTVTNLPSGALQKIEEDLTKQENLSTREQQQIETDHE